MVDDRGEVIEIVQVLHRSVSVLNPEH